jgi:hypothetical protein
MYCKSNNIKNIKDYNINRAGIKELPTMPNRFYTGFTNIQ